MRRIRLTPATRRMCVQMVVDAPEGYMFTPPQEPTRNLEQNARLWAMLGDIAAQVHWSVNGRLEKLTPEEWKDILTASLYQEQRMAQGVRGGYVMLGRRTSKMTVRQMSELIEFLFAFGAEQGVVWSEEIRVPEWAAA